MPTLPNQLENEISDNDVNFDKELPLENEYYRTSTDKDDFVRPNPVDTNSEIDDNGEGIDLSDDSFQSLIPTCNYQITITDYYGAVQSLNIDVQGLMVKNGRKKNLPLRDFTKLARKQIFERIRGSNLTQETQKTLTEVTHYLRQIFAKTYGYEDSCGISITLHSEFEINNNAEIPESIPTDDNDSVNSTSTTEGNIIRITTDETIITVRGSETPVNIEITRIDQPVEAQVTAITPDVIEETTIEPKSNQHFITSNPSDLRAILTTTESRNKSIASPKLRSDIQAIINVYKALNNWRY